MSTENSVTLLPTASQLAAACKAIAYATKRIDESKVKLANVTESKKALLPSFLQKMIDAGTITVKAKGEGQKAMLVKRIETNEKRLTDKLSIIESVGLTLSDIVVNKSELLSR